MRDGDGSKTLIPIPTEFGGIIFRSRTEARWAVFFTTAEIAFQYEPDGFDLDGIRYLPDFWLPDLKLFVEIKPFAEATAREIDKCRRLTVASGHPTLMVKGDPGLKTGLLFFKDTADYEMNEPPNAFLAICRRCPKIVLPYTSQDGCAWGEFPLFGGPCAHNRFGFCDSDRVSPFGYGFETAINAACDFTWKPAKGRAA